MKLDPELSERITMLRLPLIAGVVFLHSYDTVISRTTQLHYSGWVRFVCDYISEGVATVSVPLLFLIAGYLFYYGFDQSRSGFALRISKRVRSLLVPYLCWNALCLLLMLVAQSIPASSKYFGGRSAPIAAFSLFDYLNAIVGLTTRPIAYQFWFVRDLLLLALLSPLLYIVLQRAAIPFLALVALWWSASNVWTMPILSRESILFFSIGGLIAIREVNPLGVDRFAIFSLMYLPLSLLDAYMQQSPNGPIHKVAELCGIVFVFCATKYLRQWSACRRALLTLSSASFFVFATHEPLLTLVRKISYQVWTPASNTAIISLYFANSVGVVVVCTITYYLCRRVIPQLTSVMTGGR